MRNGSETNEHLVEQLSPAAGDREVPAPLLVETKAAARLCGVSRSHFLAMHAAGRLRLYDAQAVAMIRHAISAMDARKGVGND